MSEGIKSSIVLANPHPILAGGQATLVAGTVTVSTPLISANSQVILTNALVGGTAGVLSVGTVVSGISFVINSSNASDTSTVNWFLVG